MSSTRIAPALDLQAFANGLEAGLASVAEQCGGRPVAIGAGADSPLPSPGPANAAAVQSTLDAIQAVRRIAGEVRLSAEERLHYLRCIRLNLASTEDRLAGDDMAPCIAEKLGDIAHAIQHAAANPED
ncbi:hypothetical protein OS176_07800 [Xanthomonadaceae bacterium XH05]|nr:hypothetical protein [Xanthomonadaceae bacterium XH05]